MPLLMGVVESFPAISAYGLLTDENEVGIAPRNLGTLMVGPGGYVLGGEKHAEEAIFGVVSARNLPSFSPVLIDPNGCNSSGSARFRFVTKVGAGLTKGSIGVGATGL